MDFKELTAILKKYAIFIATIAVLGAAVGFFSKSFFASGYHLEQTYFVGGKTASAQNIAGSNSETYYTQENLRAATDSFVAILQSVDFQKEAVSAPDALQVRKIAPQIIRLTYTSQSAQNIPGNLNQVVDKFNEKIGDLEQGSPTARLKPVGSTSAPTHSKLNSLSLLIAGWLLGTVFALFVVGLKEYNKL